MTPATIHDAPSGAVVVTPHGELDVTAGRSLREVLREACAAARTVIVDLTHVTFIDSTTLGVFLATHRRSEADNCNLVVVNPSPRVMAMLRITGLLNLLDVRPAEAGELAPAYAGPASGSFHRVAGRCAGHGVGG